MFQLHNATLAVDEEKALQQSAADGTEVLRREGYAVTL
jgi:hypothetical protein